MPINHDQVVLLDEAGNLYCCGTNSQGELGFGDKTLRSELTLLPTMKFVSVAAGYNDYTLGCAKDGSLWGWGSNEYGQCGLGEGQFSVKVPTQITIDSHIVSVSAGYYHSLALDRDGHVWSCGYNHRGCLGLGDTSNRDIPTKIESLPQIQAISCGDEHSLFLDIEGVVWSCGRNDYGQLGQCTSEESVLIPGQAVDLPQIKSIAGGYFYSLVLSVDGQVFGFGQNDYGQIGVQDRRVNPPAKIMEDVAYIWCGKHSSYAQCTDGRVFVFGDNEHCVFGHDWKEREYREPTENHALFDKWIIPGYTHMFAISPDGEISFHGALKISLKFTNPGITLGNIRPRLPRSAVKSARKIVC